MKRNWIWNTCGRGYRDKGGNKRSSVSTAHSWLRSVGGFGLWGELLTRFNFCLCSKVSRGGDSVLNFCFCLNSSHHEWARSRCETGNAHLVLVIFWIRRAHYREGTFKREDLSWTVPSETNSKEKKPRLPPHTLLHGTPPGCHIRDTWMALWVSSACGFEQPWTSGCFEKGPGSWPSPSPSHLNL